ncbi:protein of unknown function [Paraburkholderia dioscoreae]|uniref:Uncharacterized protein n=1 Tax=Paraburkholderia dioscoreae TaxID=2604047 RepID=A0A5Q4Z672_9BURK|nr:protein of unknown function [Paraburkholderia dioscoreae]
MQTWQAIHMKVTCGYRSDSVVSHGAQRAS